MRRGFKFKLLAEFLLTSAPAIETLLTAIG
jgi:hypothetical protein